jgi:hypothetical protein
MSTQSHIDPPVDPSADPASAQEQRMSRRSVLRGAAVGAGAVGLATVAGITPALASPRPASRTATGKAGEPAAASAGPIVVYLRDAASGELEVFAGNTQVRLHDPAMAARLTRAVR